jgi:hypothetical protein
MAEKKKVKPTQSAMDPEKVGKQLTNEEIVAFQRKQREQNKAPD